MNEPKTIKLCDDGVYRWSYEFAMLKNPVIFFTVLRIFFFVLLGMWVFFGALRIGNDGFFGAFIEEAKGLLIPAVILFVLSIVAYLILACIYGFKYCVLFEMSETGIRHIQMEKQFKKAQAIGWLTAFTGAAANNLAVTGSGLLSATKNEMHSEFSKTKKVKSLKRYSTIKVNGALNHNQIYVPKEDYDFVLEYITSRVPKKQK